MKLVPKSRLKRCKYSRTYELNEYCRVSRIVTNELYSKHYGANYSLLQWYLVFSIYFDELEPEDLKGLLI